MKWHPLIHLLALLSAAVAAPNPSPLVVPAVHEWTGGEGTLEVETARILVDASHQASLAGVAAVLQSDLATLRGGPIGIEISDKPAAGAVFLTLTKPDAARPADFHRLEIDESVRLSASTPTGVFYATRTLLQMVARSPDGMLPRGTVTDWPDSRGRMLMLDVARKPFPIPVLKDYIRMMAWYKMNELHLHFTDESRGDRYPAFRIESKKFPGLHSKDLFYTWEELRELQDFAAARGMTITPEIDMPGHARPLTVYWPELKHPKLGESNLDITNPKTAETMKALLDEMIPLFDAPDFHIGTDEYRMGGLAKEEQAIAGEAFRKFINEMNAHVRSKGKNCRIWSGWSHMPGTTEPDPSVVIDIWLGTNGKELIGKGHKVIHSSDQRTYLVPGAGYYGVNLPAIYANWHPWVFGGADKNLDRYDPNLLGGKLHVWMDMGPAGYTMTEIAEATLPSIQAFAEKMWGTKGSKDHAEFQTRAAATLPVPGVSVFERMSGGCREKDVFYSRPAETTLKDVNSTVYLPWSVASRADLEYPWTLTMEVRKTAETGKRGVILGSDLVEICSDFKRTDTKKTKGPDGKPVVEKIPRHGIGLIRASGAFGKDPADSVKALEASAAVYSDALPLNEWVKITVVAEATKTAVFLNDVKTGESKHQMVCPLRHLGSKTGNSFVGQIRNLKVESTAR
ncbi:family 20 glycosylhydrolase [Luteolibacter arcticus]|uniref:Family 20 glycosylhydrolase n=1 Tax=Luteolibacter arcticus TaxID=1581411 RepID=A0ABT3GK22_9BACT|nr:family 20 glycosylhydrolase [Luteolibacter arcticus]MCW1923868.1 family 20 glycosylhydrolase [Luteolibacter arcticus]